MESLEKNMHATSDMSEKGAEMVERIPAPDPQKHNMPWNTYRFAVCTRDGVRINEHFGRAHQVYIYDYGNDKAVFVEIREPEEMQGDSPELKTVGGVPQIPEALSDCDGIVCEKMGYHLWEVFNRENIVVLTTYDTIKNGLRKAVSSLMEKNKAAREDGGEKA